MEYVGGKQPQPDPQGDACGQWRLVRSDSGGPGHRLHPRGAAGLLLPPRLGLLYCDFKPANLIQVGDAMKLIDLGGVRRVDDDLSPIYGTVGFQAPEVPS
jgi:serine/threonine protein kinase